MQNMPLQTTDKIDRAILRVLQKDGRLSNVQLAEPGRTFRIGLPAPCSPAGSRAASSIDM